MYVYFNGNAAAAENSQSPIAFLSGAPKVYFY
jgi:hypothetical protein